MQFNWQLHADLTSIRLAQYKLISLDIFDTLIHRAVRNPTDIFVLLAKRAHQLGWLTGDISAEQFRLIRQEAEKQARQHASKQRNSSEVSFTEIWQQMPAYLGDGHKLAELELELELQLSFPNPYLIDFINFLDNQSVAWQLTSDTYFPRDHIKALLKKAKLQCEDDQLLLSHEADANKYQGQLFDVLLARYPNLLPQEILHLGDDLVADAIQPQTRQIASLHLSQIHLPLYQQQRLQLIGAAKQHNALYSLQRLGQSVQLAVGSDRALNAFALSTYGPVLAGFCAWLAFDAVGKGIKRLCPIMREARVFKPLLEQLIAEFKLPLTVHAFYTSRKAAYLAQMQELDDAAINQFRNRRSYSLQDLIDELELPAAPAGLQHELSLRLNDVTDQTLLLSYLKSDEVQRAARQCCAEQTQLLKQYCKECFADEPVAMIDIGPGGNSLSWVAQAIGEQAQHIQNNYLMYAIPEQKKHLVNGHRITTYLPTDAQDLTKNRVLNRCPEPLEILLTGRDETTLRYQRSAEGRAEAKTAAVFHHPKQVARLEDFMTGATQAMAHLCHLLQYVSAANLFDIETRRAQLSELYALLELPSPGEAECLGSLIFDDNYGSNHYSHIVSERDKKLVQDMGCQRFMQLCRSQWGYNGMAVRWPQAAVTQLEPAFLTKQYLQSFNDTEFDLLCYTLVQRALDDDCSSVIIYGAGVLGQQMLSTALQMGLAVSAIVDTNPALHGLKIATYQVQSLTDAIAQQSTTSHCYLVASSAFASAIANQLRHVYQQQDASLPAAQLHLYAIHEGSV